MKIIGEKIKIIGESLKIIGEKSFINKGFFTEPFCVRQPKRAKLFCRLVRKMKGEVKINEMPLSFIEKASRFGGML